LLTQAFRHAPPAMLAPFSYGQILFAGMYGYLVFDHMPDTYGVVGISVVCLSGLAVAWGQRKR
jgi:drug/metabolite transporter (DMT)-like permease